MGLQAVYWDAMNAYRLPGDPVVGAFARPKLRFVQQHLPLTSEQRVLDVGCGNGTFQHYLSELAPTVGVDYSQNMLEMNRQPWKLRGTVFALPFPDHSFDVVFESCLLHHVEDPFAALAELRRVSRRFVVLNEPNRNNPPMLAWSLVVPAERGGLRFTPDHLRRIAQRAGLHVLGQQTAGLVYQNKTPAFLLPLLRRFDRPIWFGAYSTLVGAID